MKHNTPKYLLAGLFIFLLWAPSIQSGLNIFKGGELKGAFVKPDDVTFDFENWFSGSYSEKKETYIRCNFGFQGDMVRLCNQINYSLFDKANVNNVVAGRDNYLYEQQYIDCYYGADYGGDSAIRERVTLLKELQDTLARHNIFLFVAFAPGKGSFYPEYIPHNHMPLKKGRTNFDACIKYCNQAGLNYIDLRSYFLAIKDTSSYRLYSRGGIHWSYYGDLLAFDTIIDYLRQKTAYNIPQLKTDSVQLSTVPRYRDNDARQALNLIKEYNFDSLAYPFFTVTDTNRTLNFMTIGDSYYWNMQSFNSPLVFRNSSFWYYFDKIYSDGQPVVENEEAHAKLKDYVLKQNVICIMQTDAGLKDLGYEFPAQAIAKFKGER